MEEGKLDAPAGERFDRIDNGVVPNLKRMLAFFRQHGFRVIYLTYASEAFRKLKRSLSEKRGFASGSCRTKANREENR